MRLMDMIMSGEVVGRKPPRYCEQENCSQPTREGKPFCSAHVREHPYVRKLIEDLERAERQDLAAAKGGVRMAEATAITALEILQHLEFHGPRTVERLARELNTTYTVVEAYAKRLKIEGKVKLGKTKRHSTLVKLVN